MSLHYNLKLNLRGSAPEDQLLPPNMAEMTVEEFAQSAFFTYMPDAMEYRQVQNISEEDCERLSLNCSTQNMYLFYQKTPNHDGIVMVRDYWRKTVRYFRFQQCQHEMVDDGSRGTLHQSKCTKCDYRYGYDSSD